MQFNPPETPFETFENSVYSQEYNTWSAERIPDTYRAPDVSEVGPRIDTNRGSVQEEFNDPGAQDATTEPFEFNPAELEEALAGPSYAGAGTGVGSLATGLSSALVAVGGAVVAVGASSRKEDAPLLVKDVRPRPVDPVNNVPIVDTTLPGVTIDPDSGVPILLPKQPYLTIDPVVDAARNDAAVYYFTAGVYPSRFKKKKITYF